MPSLIAYSPRCTPLPVLTGSDFNSILEYALRSRDLELAKASLERGADPTSRCGNALHDVTRLGYREGLALLFDDLKKRGADTSAWATEVLEVYAARTQHDPQIVRFLLDQGATISSTNPILKVAMFTGEPKLAKDLLARGATLDTVAWSELLHGMRDAPIDGHKEILAMLLSQHPQTLRRFGRDGLETAVQTGQYEAVKTMIEAKKPQKFTATSRHVFRAIEIGDLELFKVLYENLAGLKPLKASLPPIAARLGKTDIFEYLVERGAVQKASLDAIASAAACHGHFEMCTWALSHGANPGAALSYAALRANVEQVKHLLSCGAEPNTPPGFKLLQFEALGNNSYLHNKSPVESTLIGAELIAGRKSQGNILPAAHKETLKVLKDAGASFAGSALWSWATTFPEITPYLLDEVEEPSSLPDEALDSLVRTDQIELLKQLLSKGFQPTRGTLGALHHATRQGNLDLVRFLIEDLGAEVFASHLESAVASHNFELAKYLLSVVPDRTNYLAELSAGKGYIQWIEQILYQVPDPTRVLFKAVQEGQLAVVQLILDKGAIDRTTFDSTDVLYSAALKNDTKILSYLLRQLSLKPEALAPALAAALEAGNRKAVFMLTQAGALTRPNSVGGNHITGCGRAYLDLSDAIIKLPKGRSFAEAGELLAGSTTWSSLDPRFRDGLLGSPKWTETNLFKVAMLCAEAAASGVADKKVAKRIFRSLLPYQLCKLQESRAPIKETLTQLRERMSELENFPDVVARVATEIVIPYWATHPGCRDNPRNFTDYEVMSLTTRAKGFTCEKLFEGRTLQQILALNSCMHKPKAALQPHHTPLGNQFSWPALIVDPIQLSSGYSIVALSNSMALRYEGSRLDHCVGSGSYTTNCVHGTMQILSVRYHDQPVATLTLTTTRDPDGLRTHASRTWRVYQFKGLSNSDPDPQAKMAVAEFFDRITSGKLSCNPEVAYYKGSTWNQNSRLSAIERLIAMPLDEPELVEQIRIHYQQKIERNLKMPVLPESVFDIELLHTVLSPKLNRPVKRPTSKRAES
jgi:hypothetical protein